MEGAGVWAGSGTGSSGLASSATLCPLCPQRSAHLGPPPSPPQAAPPVGRRLLRAPLPTDLRGLHSGVRPLAFSLQSAVISKLFRHPLRLKTLKVSRFFVRLFSFFSSISNQFEIVPSFTSFEGTFSRIRKKPNKNFHTRHVSCLLFYQACVTQIAASVKLCLYFLKCMFSIVNNGLFPEAQFLIPKPPNLYKVTFPMPPPPWSTVDPHPHPHWNVCGSPPS